MSKSPSLFTLLCTIIYTLPLSLLAQQTTTPRTDNQSVTEQQPSSSEQADNPTLPGQPLLPTTEPFTPTPLELGANAPAFVLPGTDGQTHQLSDFDQAEILVVIFTCNHCPDARAARQKIIDLHNDYHQQGVAVVTISGNDDSALRLDELGYSVYRDSLADMIAVSNEEEYPFPYLYDGESQQVTRAYGALATPHVFIFDDRRQLRYKGRLDDGRRDPNHVGTPYARNAINALLENREIAQTSTRPYGCSTKWSFKRDSVARNQAEWEALAVSLHQLDLGTARHLRANHSEQLRLINFWASYCIPCVAELPDLLETYRRYQNRGFQLITISLDTSAGRPSALELLQQHHIATSPRTLPALNEEQLRTNYLIGDAEIDPIADAIDDQWQGGIPHTVLIAPGGDILWRHSGQFDPIELRRAIMSYYDNQVQGE